MIKDLPRLEEFEAAALTNRVSRHQLGSLVGFKYTEQTIYSQDWDLVTLNARGIVFDSTNGEVVAFPFRKFFNYGELFCEPKYRTLDDGTVEEIEPLISIVSKYDTFTPRITGKISRCMDKLDGSLGIAFYYDGKWQVKTGGSFESDQAKWANSWLNNNVALDALVVGNTYLFEIIYDADIHPIKYDYEGMVLLAVIDNVTGEEYSTEYIVDAAKNIGVRCAEIYSFDSLDDIIPFATSLPSDKEGVVVTFDSGFKCKVKGLEFLSLQRLFHSLSMKYIWHSYDPVDDKFYMNLDKHNQWKRIDDKELFIPEELTEVRAYADNMRASIKDDFTYVLNTAKEAVEQCPMQKDRYTWIIGNVKTRPQLTGAVLSLANAIAANPNVCKYDNVLVNIWRTYKPTNDFKYLENEDI